MSEVQKEMKKEESNFDLNSLVGKCEIWVKEGKFNDSIDLVTTQLVVLDHDNPRKMIFNLYNGKLSTTGKSTNLNLDDFFSGIAREGSKTFWYKIDPIKYKKSLESKGYTPFEPK
jgi:hypothetical protein